MGFQGVRQGQGEQAAYGIVLAAVHQLRNVRGRNQTAGGIVHQHPVVRVRATVQQVLQAVAHTFRTAGATDGCVRDALRVDVGRHWQLCKPAILRSQHQQDAINACTGTERRQRMPQQGMPGQWLVLLGNVAAAAAAAARAGDQCVKSACHARNCA